LDDVEVKDDYATGVEIVRRALTEPAYLIATNAGYAGHEVVDRLGKLGVDEGFDALEGRYGNMIEMGIIDPLRVARSALQNGGAALLHAEPALDELQVKDDYATGVEIVRSVLPEPAYLIAANAGYNGQEVVARMTQMGKDDGFDALEGRFGNMIEMGIIDPLRVARSALQNGASVAGLPPQGVCSSATRVLVVRSRPATEAPFCRAERATRSGSMMPISIMLPYRPSSASKPSSTPSLLSRSTTSCPAKPAFVAIR
jgi:chaperonin GroEL (HSP60 family)